MICGNLNITIELINFILNIGFFVFRDYLAALFFVIFKIEIYYSLFKMQYYIYIKFLYICYNRKVIKEKVK